jgi:hypothetical protein
MDLNCQTTLTLDNQWVAVFCQPRTRLSASSLWLTAGSRRSGGWLRGTGSAPSLGPYQASLNACQQRILVLQGKQPVPTIYISERIRSDGMNGIGAQP